MDGTRKRLKVEGRRRCWGREQNGKQRKRRGGAANWRPHLALEKPPKKRGTKHETKPNGMRSVAFKAGLRESGQRGQQTQFPPSLAKEALT